METLSFETSMSTQKLDQALAKAQSEMEDAELNCENIFFHSKYADLSSVWKACRKALTSNGISVTQWPIHSSDGRLHMVTRLGCSGEWIKGIASAPMSKQDIHGFGGSITYLKRYALCAAIGIVDESDDDGNHASAKPVQKPEIKKPDHMIGKPIMPKNIKNEDPVTAAIVKSLGALVEARGITHELFCQYLDRIYKVDSKQPLKTMKCWQAEELLKLLEDPRTSDTTLFSKIAEEDNAKVR